MIFSPCLFTTTIGLMLWGLDTMTQYISLQYPLSSSILHTADQPVKSSVQHGPHPWATLATQSKEWLGMLSSWDTVLWIRRNGEHLLYPLIIHSTYPSGEWSGLRPSTDSPTSIGLPINFVCSDFFAVSIHISVQETWESSFACLSLLSLATFCFNICNHGLLASLSHLDKPKSLQLHTDNTLPWGLALPFRLYISFMILAESVSLSSVNMVQYESRNWGSPLLPIPPVPLVGRAYHVF